MSTPEDDPGWIDGPSVMAADPTVAFTEDEMWAVSHDGGMHCGSRAPGLLGVGCLLAVDHDGPHIPGADELLAEGVRLTPLVVLR